MRAAIQTLAGTCTVGVISGRDLVDVRRLVGLEGIYYAGSHGFEIAGPEGDPPLFQKGTEFLPSLDRVEDRLRQEAAGFPGIRIERKKFSVAVHFRMADEVYAAAVGRIVEAMKADYPELRLSHGKKIHEFHPGIEWNKGKALLWILEELQMYRPDVLPLYIGDDTTDEDAFEALKGWGVGIVVLERPRASAAQYVLKNPQEVKTFLDRLIAVLSP